MITPDQALGIVLAHLAVSRPEHVPLAHARGRVLHVPIWADRDFPPFDRVTMDGIALEHASWASDPGQWLRVAGTQLAGQPPLTLSGPHQCLEAMTGATLPSGADTVVRYEDLETEWRGTQKWVKIKAGVAVAQGQSLHLQARDRAKGDLLLAPGRRLGPAEVAVAATVGHTHLSVASMPRFAVVSTGDELVEIGAQPLPHQVRRSNAAMLQAALLDWQAEADLFHLADEPTALRAGLADLLAQYDVVLLSGGVSEGVADLVPGALADLGVEKVFHKVAQRPGKPFWFGARPASPVWPRSTTVFALPGNPVSTFCCYYQYVAEWLGRSLGWQPGPPLVAQLTTDLAFAPELTYFVPVAVGQAENGTLLANPVATSGSGDLASLLAADGLLELAPALRDGTKTFRAGTLAKLKLFREKN
jgi:molybdopterin molybdotransferase